ncbi:transmembrane protein [Thalictrum thalictroides]|uniref:Transmembrane protein n=1 Tax=Thalictrum thalictroides TaxID=46969 RepID=A0A7J6WA81_THATH|nr:transmembrane protein [Thalictrum thalictroides]
MEENNRLRVELQKRTIELERHNSNDSTDRLSQLDASRDEHIHGPSHQTYSAAGSQEDRFRWKDDTPLVDRRGTLVVHQNAKNVVPSIRNHEESQHYSENNNVNGPLKVFTGGQAGVDNTGVSQFSSPSSRSISPSRYQREGDYNLKNISAHGLMPISEVNSQNSLWKQDLVLKVRDQEEEILQLRRHLADYSVKEAQICNEKYALEKRIAYMRMAFDQQQQEIVDAASKSLSYRQDIIEENIRLTYALQAAQQEKSTFVSSLLPLLVDYSLQPPVLDAQPIASGLKILFKHLQEKLLITEAKLKESQHQVAPWRSELSDLPNFTRSPSPSIGAALTTSNIMGLELVPQPAYSHRLAPLSPSDALKNTEWDQLVQHNPHTGFVGLPGKSLDLENLGRPVPSTVRSSAAQDVPAQSQGDSHTKRFPEEITTTQPFFRDLRSGSEMDDPDSAGREQSTPWGSGNSPYMTPTHDDPNSSFSPYLAPVLEEPSSSFSEAGEDDPLPAIDGLQISGEAFPGQELQAGGYSINGTTSCNFEWVRYFEDGSVNYIDGAKQPNYLVTADDVDTYLAIEVQPLDNRKRKGELVKVFANEQRKITCDSEMQEQIERSLYSGQASYEVSLAARYLDIWEPAILAVKREGYSIKCVGTRGVVVTEKFLQKTAVTIPYGHPTAFSILGSAEHLLRTENSSLRDTIVLTMRLFIMRAVEKRKSKKKGMFF